jgi:hypothetical protein
VTFDDDKLFVFLLVDFLISIVSSDDAGFYVVMIILILFVLSELK